MPTPRDTTAVYIKALHDIQTILISTHPDATPGEKLVRVGWVIAALPPEQPDTIIGQAQRRCGVGWMHGLKPTEFDQ